MCARCPREGLEERTRGGARAQVDDVAQKRLERLGVEGEGRRQNRVEVVVQRNVDQRFKRGDTDVSLDVVKGDASHFSAVAATGSRKRDERHAPIDGAV